MCLTCENTNTHWTPQKEDTVSGLRDLIGVQEENLSLSYVQLSKFRDRIEGLECREVQYKKHINRGLLLNLNHRVLLRKITIKLADIIAGNEGRS